jgi:hypothetical protein
MLQSAAVHPAFYEGRKPQNYRSVADPFPPRARIPRFDAPHDFSGARFPALFRLSLKPAFVRVAAGHAVIIISA